MSGTAQLADALRAEGGLLADALRDDDPAPPDEPLLADVPPGPYALTLAAVREGYLLHYGEGRVTDVSDTDLALLGGDRLYALALAELAALGDLEAVATLADLISDCARAHADDEPTHAAATWEAAAQAIARQA
ncbi:MAG TPA: hypothetical protein VKB25_02645 [Conexibacter sp.]|nr:hypothetical protein [Conexibacter sp.]